MEKLLSLTVCKRIGFALLLALSLVVQAETRADCQQPGQYESFVNDNYPAEIAFDVFRNDKLVGEHVTRFQTLENGLSVKSRMALEIKFLFIKAYEFEYLSDTLWCSDKLQSLEATTDRNGEISRVSGKADDDTLVISSANGEARTTREILTTDHWNPMVLNRNEVLNTITGSVNNVAIRPCGQGTPRVEKAAPDASCYEYTGDLNTRVWYDSLGRWRGLEFKGDDGSTITYVCKRCT